MAAKNLPVTSRSVFLTLTEKTRLRIKKSWLLLKWTIPDMKYKFPVWKTSVNIFNKYHFDWFSSSEKAFPRFFYFLALVALKGAKWIFLKKLEKGPPKVATDQIWWWSIHRFMWRSWFNDFPFLALAAPHRGRKYLC